MDPDLPLIEALQAGDDSALNELIIRHREALFRFVNRYLRDETVAADVVQETFVRVYFKASKFQPQATVKTWLYAIALNLCRDQFRRVVKKRREQSIDAPRAAGGSTSELVESGPSPDIQAGQQENYVRLQASIDRLPSRLRDAFILFAIEGKSQKEAAEILGTTPKTVETRVYHAKHKLRQWLGALIENPAHRPPKP